MAEDTHPGRGLRVVVWRCVGDPPDAGRRLLLMDDGAYSAFPDEWATGQREVVATLPVPLDFDDRLEGMMVACEAIELVANNDAAQALLLAFFAAGFAAGRERPGTHLAEPPYELQVEESENED